MARVATGLAPEMMEETDKVRTLKDGSKRYYRNGMLHRDPYHGPAVEFPDGSGDCYVNGIMVDAKYLHGIYFENDELRQAAVVQTVPQSMDTVTSKMPQLQPQLPPPQRVKPEPKYLPSLATEKPKHRDRFDKMASRLKGNSMSDLQKLYAELSTNKGDSQNG
jgi:hypothetical protein